MTNIRHVLKKLDIYCIYVEAFVREMITDINYICMELELPRQRKHQSKSITNIIILLYSPLLYENCVTFNQEAFPTKVFT